MTDINFIDRVAIVTGAGGGLGRTYALELASRGAAVVVNDLGGSTDGTGSDASAAQKVVDEIKAGGGNAVANHDSVSTPEGGAAIVQAAVDNFGKVDVVINNAGILRDKSFANLEFENLDAVLDVHLKGAFYVSQPAFKVMKENGYGRFVFTASNAGVLGNFGQSNYGAAKMGLVGLSNVIAIEGAKAGIASNVICPLARTRMTEDLLGPLAELLEPDKVTPMVTYLASEANPYTHELFSAGGGRYARFFIGLAPGWFGGKGVDVSAEDISEHIDEIRHQDGYLVPGSVNDEFKALLPLLKG
ncbi:MAG TPA: SDR family NAD(P)-dependent oxidoreductase [Pseudonocardia sp.]|nr:SDR family NAD(P)-dependent oxidoreductase [Pseudonocardia sp.]